MKTWIKLYCMKGGTKMFFIKSDMEVSSKHMLHDTLVNLSYYKVYFYSLYTDDNEIIVVDKERRKGDLRLAEMAFQMDSRYRQEGFVCPICKKEGKEICGHLTFVPR